VKGVEFFGPEFRFGERSNEKIECLGRWAFLKLVQLLARRLGVVSVNERSWIENDNYSFSMQPMEMGEVRRFGCFSFGKNQNASFLWRRRWFSGWT
jgi:hypothetical protein